MSKTGRAFAAYLTVYTIIRPGSEKIEIYEAAGKRYFNYGKSVITKAAKSAGTFYESIGEELAEMFVMDMEEESGSE